MHTPAFHELLAILRTHHVESDPVHIAAVVLEIYRERYRADDGADLRKWMEQLAVDTIHVRSEA